MKRRVETALGILLVLALVLKSGTRTMMRVWLSVAFDQLRALPPLLRDDFAGTAGSFGLMLLRLGIALIPALFLIRAAPWYRRIWLIAAVFMAVIFCSPVSLSSCGSLGAWLLLLSLATAATLLRRRMPWLAILPFFVLLQSMPSHVLAARRSHDVDFRRDLLAGCQRRQVPANLTAELLKPAHAITAVDAEWLLLTGQGQKDDVMFGVADARPGSWWLRRADGKLLFDRPSAAEGRLWRACVLDGTLWSAQATRLVGARRDGDGEVVSRIHLPTRDLDMGDTACAGDRLYVGEGTLGGIWEVTPGSNHYKRHEIGRIALLPMRRFDGKIVVNSTAALNVFDGERVIEQVGSALLSVGFDLCSQDGTAAVADETGRLRIFTLENGRYRFAWGLPLFAPRRVAWSPDCTRLAVTSSDDHSVWMVDAASHQVIETHQAGPALREVTATGPREFSITDACAVTSYRW